MEAGECGLTRGTCFATRSLELVAVAGRLWVSWCVLGRVDIFLFFFSWNAHGLLQVRGDLSSCTSLLVMLAQVAVRCLFPLFIIHSMPGAWFVVFSVASTCQVPGTWCIPDKLNIFVLRTTSPKLIGMFAAEPYAPGSSVFLCVAQFTLNISSDVNPIFDPSLASNLFSDPCGSTPYCHLLSIDRISLG